MRSAVDHTILRVKVGEKNIIGSRESELQDLHPGEAELVAQINDIRGDNAQVFGDNSKIA